MVRIHKFILFVIALRFLIFFVSCSVIRLAAVFSSRKKKKEIVSHPVVGRYSRDMRQEVCAKLTVQTCKSSKKICLRHVSFACSLRSKWKLSHSENNASTSVWVILVAYPVLLNVDHSFHSFHDVIQKT